MAQDDANQEKAARRLDVMREAPRPLWDFAKDVHDLIEQTIRTVDGAESFDADVAWARAQVQAIRERLAPHAKRREIDLARPGDSPDGRPYYVSGVMGGKHHPMVLPVEMTTADGVSRGTMNLPITWEGPPGCVHGGFIAHAFDCILGQHNVNAGIPAMTGTLTVRYRRTTPLLADLNFEVRTERQEGRKVVTHGEIRLGDEVCAEGEGIFIVPSVPLTSKAP